MQWARKNRLYWSFCYLNSNSSNNTKKCVLNEQTNTWQWCWKKKYEHADFSFASVSPLIWMGFVIIFVFFFQSIYISYSFQYFASAHTKLIDNRCDVHCTWAFEWFSSYQKCELYLSHSHFRIDATHLFKLNWFRVSTDHCC